jgi:hypothetical protein
MPQLKLAIATLLAGTVVLALVQSPSLDPAPLGATLSPVPLNAVPRQAIEQDAIAARIHQAPVLLAHDDMARARRVANSEVAP